MKQDGPLVLAIASGKGGVGKTVLSVAIARELSKVRRTLILDLDFFNRGLSGLLKGGRPVAMVAKPAFFVSEHARGQSPWRASTAEDTGWELVEVADGLVHLSFPDVAESDLAVVERLGVDGVARHLREFVRSLAELSECDAVVLDCHGGPDVASFAACIVAGHALLMSEPDDVTLHGTLHFLRKLGAATTDRRPQIHLVFNKVGEGHSAASLERLYRERLEAHFGRPLLAAFPIEPHVARSVGRSAFPTRSFPGSLLARKTELLLRQLLVSTQPAYLSPSASTVPVWVRQWRKLTLGRVAAPLRPATAMLGIFVAALLTIGMPVLEQRASTAALQRTRETLARIETLVVEAAGLRGLPRDLSDTFDRQMAVKDVPGLEAFPVFMTGRHHAASVSARRSFLLDRRAHIAGLLEGPSRDEVERLMEDLENGPVSATAIAAASESWNAHDDTFRTGVGAWLGFTFLFGWTRSLDRSFTRFSRERRRLSMSAIWLVLAILWTVTLALVVRGFDGTAYDGELAIAAAFAFGLVGLAAEQAWVAWRTARFEGLRLEPALRAGFVVAMIGVAVMLARVSSTPVSVLG